MPIATPQCFGDILRRGSVREGERGSQPLLSALPQSFSTRMPMHRKVSSPIGLIFIVDLRPSESRRRDYLFEVMSLVGKPRPAGRGNPGVQGHKGLRIKPELRIGEVAGMRLHCRASILVDPVDQR